MRSIAAAFNCSTFSKKMVLWLSTKGPLVALTRNFQSLSVTSLQLIEIR
ncbi:hypothetical protein HSIEG1_2412 [Enterococcus sp. HSIEG1]|nr:hypothetical protein HSIEG1_2412 [Enterococcus sp. HSIEG1]